MTGAESKPSQRLKFYQTGTHTVGNRLLDEAKRTVQASIQRSNAITSGHRACQGCGEALGARYALDAAMRASEGQIVAVNATGCLEVFTTPYPETSWQIPWLHSLFGNAPAVATGVAAALRVKGRDHIKVVAQGGDGGTTDIGFGCLSGMFERNDNVLYICYDNEAYMNTGVQRSSATPPAARTATTPALGDAPGTELYSGEHAITPDDQALEVIDVSDQGLSVTGPYRVGIQFQHAAAPSVGLDADGRTPGVNFVELVGSGWQESSASDDFILRTTYLPEPAASAMLAAGIILVSALGRRRARAAARTRAA